MGNQELRFNYLKEKGSGMRGKTHTKTEQKEQSAVIGSRHAALLRGHKR